MEGNAYAADDLSQFAVDSEDPDTGLNLQLIDLDKILVTHDAQLRWYVAELLMPFVATQLLRPLSPLLPGLRDAISVSACHRPSRVPPPSPSFSMLV